MPSLWYGVLVVVVLIISDFLCINATTSQSNVWTRQQNSSWVGPPTTPWPALGAKKPYNQPVSSNSGVTPNKLPQHQNIAKNTNRNVGVDLSYGPGTGGNVGQNLNTGNVGVSSGNINGVALSYGLNYNKNNPSPKQKVTASSTSSQNVNAPKTVPTYSNIVRQNSNDQNSLKSSQVSNVSTVKPVTQINSQNLPATANKLQQSSITAGSAIQPTTPKASTIDEDEELRQFSEALLRKDVNNAGKYVTINYQGKTTSRSLNDEAPLPLLTIQKEAYNIPSISDLLQLHNNYVLETNVNEHVSAQEKMEENTLLDTILSTSVMQHTKNFLIEKGVIPKDPKHFKDKLKEIWFNMYSRGQGRIGSSGFEHVFLAEIKNQDPTGLHNWVYFHDAEAKKLANYLGYMKTLEMNNNKGAILKYHMNFNGIDKPVSSMFIGTSPELEIALYSTCFLLRPDQVCPLRFDGKRFIIRTYTFRYRGKNMIGSAFPEI